VAKIKSSKSGKTPDVKKQSILPGDLVVFKTASNTIPLRHTRTGYVKDGEGRFRSPGTLLYMNDVFLYIGRAAVRTGDQDYDIIIKDDEKLYVWDLLPELKKYNG